MAVGGAAEALGGGAHIGAGNDPAHAVVAPQDLAGLVAGIVQLLQGDQLLMGRHLEHRVGGGIDDPLAGIQLLLAVIPDHIGAGIGLVAQPAPAGGLLKGIQHLLGEALRVGGQGLGRDHTGNFPVADGGILAHGAFRQPGIGPCGGLHPGQTLHSVNVAKTRGDHIGNVQLPGGGAGSQGIDIPISKGFAVRHGADAEGIQNN